MVYRHSIAQQWYAWTSAGTPCRISHDWYPCHGLPIWQLAGWAIVEHPITKTGTVEKKKRWGGLYPPHQRASEIIFAVKANTNREQNLPSLLEQLCRNIVPTRAEPNLFGLCRVQPIFNEVKCSFAYPKEEKTCHITNPSTLNHLTLYHFYIYRQ